VPETRVLPNWLPEHLAGWVRANAEVLDAIYAAFDEDGEWPGPGPLQRRLISRGRRLRVVSAVQSLPSGMGRRTFEPDRVALSLHALACVPAAAPLLDRYMAVIELARKRYGQPDEPARLSRELVVGELGLSQREADRLSRIVLDDHPFLASGSAALDAWDMSIDDRIVDFDDAGDRDGLLAMFASMRGLGGTTPAHPLSKADFVDGATTAAAATAPSPQTDELAAARRPVAAGVPSAALAVFGRWWQLETYVRDVVYTELRARFGESWVQHLEIGDIPKRVAKDDVNTYMASADAGELLTYADAFVLFGIVDRNWDLFEPVLLPRDRWRLLATLLREIRNRNAHCRRPHRDDLGRLEQALRDLEAGASRFFGSYQSTRAPSLKREPLARAWVKGLHPVAARLLDHADRQYDVRFRLEYSHRPWVDPSRHDSVNGRPGVLWHATWLLGAVEVPVADLWRRLAGAPGKVQDRIVHLLATSSSITATFAAADDADAIADAIGHVFDALLTVSRHGERDFAAPPHIREHWRAGVGELPRRVQVDSALALFDPANPVRLFDADGS
jgi:hypothetical protein